MDCLFTGRGCLAVWAEETVSANPDAVAVIVTMLAMTVLALEAIVPFLAVGIPVAFALWVIAGRVDSYFHSRRTERIMKKYAPRRSTADPLVLVCDSSG